VAGWLETVDVEDPLGGLSAPPSLVSSQLRVSAQQNSAIHKEKYLWKLQLRVSISSQ
jgi:hypothetical protein